MDQPITRHLAECSCGQLKAHAQADPIRVSMCHCYACQRRTGSVFAAQARFAADQVRIEGRATPYVRIGDEGGRATFSFCPHCGATVYYVIDGRPESIIIPVGAFADARFAAPTFSVYEERMHAWVAVPEGAERLQ